MTPERMEELAEEVATNALDTMYDTNKHIGDTGIPENEMAHFWKLVYKNLVKRLSIKS